tara:strand:+ start:2194 stop:2469 length:276 start_codon:yes stop_codon:yes gene_type:complete
MGQECNHTPGVVDEAYCKQISSVPARAERCAECTCKWRVTGTKPADPEDGLPVTSRRFEKMGTLALQGHSSSNSSFGAGGGTQQSARIGSR